MTETETDWAEFRRQQQISDAKRADRTRKVAEHKANMALLKKVGYTLRFVVTDTGGWNGNGFGTDGRSYRAELTGGTLGHRVEVIGTYDGRVGGKTGKLYGRDTITYGLAEWKHRVSTAIADGNIPIPKDSA